jgi:hypothetical protein
MRKSAQAMRPPRSPHGFDHIHKRKANSFCPYKPSLVRSYQTRASRIELKDRAAHWALIATIGTTAIWNDYFAVRLRIGDANHH